MAPAKGGTQSRRTVVSAMGPVLDIGRGTNAPRPGATAKTRLSFWMDQWDPPKQAARHKRKPWG